MIGRCDNTGRFSGVVGNAMVEIKNQFVQKSYNPDYSGFWSAKEKQPNNWNHHARVLLEICEILNSDSYSTPQPAKLPNDDLRRVSRLFLSQHGSQVGHKMVHLFGAQLVNGHADVFHGVVGVVE